MKKSKLKLTAIALIIAASTQLTGCIKPYQKPVFENVETHESAFLIPLVGDTTSQSQFSSEEFLEKNMVATKRVEIPTKWVKTGRFANQGQYMPTAKLVKVDRKAVTREWTDSTTTGTSSENQGLIAESVESIAFMAKMNCTASIEEKNSAKFLYNYNVKSLAETMDTEIRALVESKFTEECAKLKIEEILLKKAEIMDNVRTYVIDHFASKGITISNLGLKGEFTYLDPSIQESINQRFIAENNAKAQEIENETAKKKAIADAEAIKTQASTLNEQIRLIEAQAKLKEAEAEMAKAEAMKEWKNVQVIGDSPLLFNKDK